MLDGECRNGRLGPLTVAATLTRPFLRTGGRFLDVSATPGQFAIAHQSATPTLNLPTAQVHSVRPDAPRKEIASGENRVISVDEE